MSAAEVRSSRAGDDARFRRARALAYGVAAACFVLSFAHRVAPAAIADELQQAFQAGGAALGALAATYFYVYTIMQVPTGILVDTLGPRRIVTAGAVIAGAGSVLFGMAQTLAAAAAGRTLVGLGVSVMFVAMLKIAAAWFPERQFATVTGVGVLCGNFGAVLAAAPLAWVVTWTSWRNVFVFAGGVALLLALLAWRFMHDSPASAGFRGARPEGAPAAGPAAPPWREAFGRVVRVRALWPNFLVLLGVAASYSTFIALWAVPYLVHVHGMTVARAAAHTSASLAGFAVASLSLGWLSDRIGRRRPVLLAALGVHALCWLPIVFAGQLTAPASYLLFGLLGASVTGFTLCWACAKEVSPPGLSGIGTSLVNTGQFLGVGILQPLVGWVLDRSWAGAAAGGIRSYPPEGYRNGMLLLLGLMLAGFIAAFFVRETHCRNVHVR